MILSYVHFRLRFKMPFFSNFIECLPCMYGLLGAGDLNRDKNVCSQEVYF